MAIRFSLAALALAVAAVAPVAAQQKTFYVAGYGGSFEQSLRKDLFPAFEKKHGVKIEYIAGNSTDTLAKLQAQRANQQIDVAIVDDGPMYQAISLGFCGPIQGLPAADIFDAARYKDNKAVGIGLVGTGIMYNTRYFKEKGWAPPHLLERPEGPEVQEAAGDPADQQHLRPAYAGDVRAHERRQRKGDRPRLQGNEGTGQSQRARL